MTPETPRRPDAADSRAAIADLVHGYARHIRNGEGAAGAGLFTADGTFEIRIGQPGETTTRTRLEGREAIHDYLTQGDLGEARLFPVIHNLMIAIDGDTASANSMMQTLGTGVFGEYHDSFRYDGGWRFSARVFTIYGRGAG